MSEKVIYAAILGAGTVGMGTYKLCQAMEDEIKHKTGARLVIKKILVRNIGKKRDGISEELLTDDWTDIITDDQISIIVELMGGIHPAKDYVLDALKAGKQVVTANKDLIAEYGEEVGNEANEAVADLVARSGIDGRYQHIHAYGSYGDWFPQLVEEKGTDIADCSNLDIRPYIDNMPTCMAAADLVICRAGAITLSEIQAMGKPAILIPSPNVAENHQYHNAMALVNAGAADIIEEKDLTGAALMRKTDKMLLNPEKLEKYSENSRKMAITDANERIYSVVKKVLGLV